MSCSIYLRHTRKTDGRIAICEAKPQPFIGLFSSRKNLGVCGEWKTSRNGPRPSSVIFNDLWERGGSSSGAERRRPRQIRLIHSLSLLFLLPTSPSGVRTTERRQTRRLSNEMSHGSTNETSKHGEVADRFGDNLYLCVDYDNFSNCAEITNKEFTNPSPQIPKSICVTRFSSDYQKLNSIFCSSE